MLVSLLALLVADRAEQRLHQPARCILGLLLLRRNAQVQWLVVLLFVVFLLAGAASAQAQFDGLLVAVPVAFGFLVVLGLERLRPLEFGTLLNNFLHVLALGTDDALGDFEFLLVVGHLFDIDLKFANKFVDFFVCGFLQLVEHQVLFAKRIGLVELRGELSHCPFHTQRHVESLEELAVELLPGQKRTQDGLVLHLHAVVRERLQPDHFTEGLHHCA